MSSSQKYASAIPIPNIIPHKETIPFMRSLETILAVRGSYWIGEAAKESARDFDEALPGYRMRFKSRKEGIKQGVISKDWRMRLYEKQEPKTSYKTNSF